MGGLDAVRHLTPGFESRGILHLQRHGICDVAPHSNGGCVNCLAEGNVNQALKAKKTHVTT